MTRAIAEWMEAAVKARPIARLIEETFMFAPSTRRALSHWPRIGDFRGDLPR
jgi:hypothetical protein